MGIIAIVGNIPGIMAGCGCGKWHSCDLALLLNQYDADYATNQLGVDPDRVRVVANGIPAEFLNLPLASTPSD
jgi:hypothetical protein